MTTGLGDDLHQVRDFCQQAYFFDLTIAELLVAQTLGERYCFAFVNTVTGDHLELSLTGLFAKARKIYPKWAVRF